MSVDWGTGIDWGCDYKGRHDEGVVRGRFQVPRFQTKVRHVKVFGWNVTLHKGRGGKGPLSWGGTTFRSAGAKQKHNFEQAKQKHNFEHFIE